MITQKFKDETKLFLTFYKTSIEKIRFATAGIVLNFVHFILQIILFSTNEYVYINILNDFGHFMAIFELKKGRREYLLKKYNCKYSSNAFATVMFIFQNKYYLGEKHIQIRLLDLV